MSRGTTTRRSSATRRRGRTDWAKLDRQSDADIRRAVAADRDAAPIVDSAWFAAAKIEEPQKKERISIKLDSDVLAFFRSQGARYQTRINAVLRAFMTHRTGR
jgi:uncharacterized protein (DUF4415 family)